MFSTNKKGKKQAEKMSKKSAAEKNKELKQQEARRNSCVNIIFLSINSNQYGHRYYTC